MKRICPTCKTVYDDEPLCINDLASTVPLEDDRPEPSGTAPVLPEAASLTILLAGITAAVPPKPGVLLGRDPSSPFAAVLAGLGWTNIGNLHCVIHLLGPGEAEVMDLDSRNGTFINDLRIPGNTPCPLRPGDRLRLAINREVDLQWT